MDVRLKKIKRLPRYKRWVAEYRWRNPATKKVYDVHQSLRSYARAMAQRFFVKVGDDWYEIVGSDKYRTLIT